MHLDKELDHLNQIILMMADNVKKNISDAFANYGSNQSTVVIYDDIIDQYERLVEEICLNILLKERLYARDLRKVTGILKMVADLERIGDHAEDIMEANKKFETGLIHTEKMDEIVDVVISMVNDSIMSYVKEDLTLAREVIDRDDIVDNAYDTFLQQIISDLKEKDADASLAIYTTIVVKYIERIADHAVNIAEWVIYIVSGFHKDKQIF